jgi:putative YpdA family bacillithiol system oxidoreductase
MEALITAGIFAALVLAVAVPYWLRVARHRREARHTLDKNARAGTLLPAALHPRIDVITCIGCASCVRVCPENVLGIVDGRAAIVSGTRCIGHGLCAEVCPVGAITLGFGKPGQGMEIPEYDEHYETNVPGLYLVGELSGIALIRNAVTQGVKAVTHIAATQRPAPPHGVDVVIVGAGPAGLAAALACKEKNLRYVVLEQDEIGGSVLHYPRQKLVLTSPVDLPLHGRVKVSEISKEDLLALWNQIIERFALDIRTKRKVEAIERDNGGFVVSTGQDRIRAASVVLAVGRRGSPKKLGVPGEEMSKVAYRLIEAKSYAGKNVLVVGGGDSAVEAAVGLASQSRTTVTLSYRRAEFVRLKEKNEKRIGEFLSLGRVRAIFNSAVTEINKDAVVVQEGGKILHKLPNDFVFVFAGGELPAELLRRTGIRMRTAEQDTRAA